MLVVVVAGVVLLLLVVVAVGGVAAGGAGGGALAEAAGWVAPEPRSQEYWTSRYCFCCAPAIDNGSLGGERHDSSSSAGRKWAADNCSIRLLLLFVRRVD